MRYIAFYLLLIAVMATVLTSIATAPAADITCKLGSYGKIAAQSTGRC